MSKLYRGLNKSETIRFFIVDSTDIVEEMRKIHNTSTTATAALGRLTTMAAIMGSDIKNKKERIILKIKGDGPSGLLISEVNNEGHIRSYIENSESDIPSTEENKLDVGNFVGTKGSLAVIKDYGFGEPYTGETSLISGEIAEDFANYYYQSDQLPTAIMLGVLVDTDYSVKSAGGLLIQALPGHLEDEIEALEECIKELPPISSIFVNYDNIENILDKYFSKMNFSILEIEDREYRCSCNKDRVEKALISIGQEELNRILEEDQKIEISCSFCKKIYNFDEDNIRNLISKAKK